MEHHTNQRFVPKLSTSKSNQRAHMKHHKVQSETTNGAPERFCQNGGPASPIREQEAPQSRIRDHKRSTRQTRVFSKTEHQQVNQRAQMKHLKAQSKTTKGEAKNQQKIFFRHFHLETVLIGQVTQLSQYYFAPQRWHKALPSTGLYYTKHFSVLFLLQSLHKLLPSSTLYNKACKNYFSVVLCATNLHKVLPSSTL